MITRVHHQLSIWNPSFMDDVGRAVCIHYATIDFYRAVAIPSGRSDPQVASVLGLCGFVSESTFQ